MFYGYKIISERAWSGGQSTHYEILLREQKTKLKITIKNDAYAEQSYARIYHWNENKWELVHHIAGRDLSPRQRVHCYKRDPSTDDFRHTGVPGELMRVALEILF